MNNVWVPNQASIVINIDPRMGFLRFSKITGQPNFEWKQYAVDDNGQISLLSGDIVEKISGFGTLIATIDGGYAIVFANVSNSGISSNDLFAVRAGIYGIFLARNQQTTTIPYLLFQSSLPDLNITNIRCSVEYADIAHTCVLTMKRAMNVTNVTSIANPTQFITPFFNPYYIKLRFLSSGSVLSLSTLKVNTSQDDYIVTTLPYGGYALTTFNQSGDGLLLNFYLTFFDESDNPVRWEFSENSTSTNFAGAFNILNNNTLLLAQTEPTNSWRLFVNDLPRFNGNR
ncbi:16800_t:CDS:2, partial [Racocetra fulgida]